MYNQVTVLVFAGVGSSTPLYDGVPTTPDISPIVTMEERARGGTARGRGAFTRASASYQAAFFGAAQAPAAGNCDLLAGIGVSL